MSGERDTGTGNGQAAAWRAITLVVMALAGALVLVAIIATLREADRQRDRALSLQARSYDVMILARTLSATIARSEATLGRYVIATDKQLGRLYFDDWRLAGDQVARLDKLIRDGSPQQASFDQLRRAFAERGEELSLIALSTNYGKNTQALARYYAAREAPALAAIHAALDAIIDRERGLLRARTAAAMTTVERSTAAARVLSAFGIAIVLGAIALGWLTLRATSARVVAQAEAEAERGRAEELALAVATATDALRAHERRLNQSQKMEAVGQLTGGIAHDFNNMLAVVIGGLELARRTLLTAPDTAARHIDSATEGATRAAALTRQLLAFAREDAINPEPIEPASLIAGIRDLLDRTLGDGVAVKVVDDGTGWRVRADRVQLENTLVNLAVNARDAMDGRGTLTIATSATTLADGACDGCTPGNYVAFAVTDTGCGMTPDVAARVFEPFFTTKPVGKGTGLGLSQIFGFARQLGGGVGLATAPGRGTTVTLFLPRDTAGVVAGARPAEAASAAFTGRPLDILLVEDDPRVLAATAGALEELGHRVVACGDPLTVPALLDAHDVALIVTDVLMPGITGPEMIAALDPRHANVPVLYVTGFAGEAGTSADFGGRHVLRKPFTLVALERAVASALDRAGGEAAATRPAPPDQIAAE